MLHMLLLKVSSSDSQIDSFILTGYPFCMKKEALRGTQGTGNSEFFKQNKPGHSLFSSFRAWVCDITGGKVIVAGRYVWSKGTQG